MDRRSSSHVDGAVSLAVPNVQELAATMSSGDGAEDEIEIPERYIRPEAGEDHVVSSAAGVDDLPVIDLMKLLLDPEHPDEEELARLGFACREWGFFQLVNHGIPEEVIEKTKEDIMEFFTLPLKEREKVKQLSGKIEGYGQAFVHSEEQKLDWADMMSLCVLPIHGRDMRFWPTNPNTFRDTLDRYTFEVSKVAGCLCRFMAKNLGVNPETMHKLFSDQMRLRINYYPPCKQISKLFGLTPHSDASGLTILLQTNDVQGLQIKKNSSWYPIKPMLGAFIVNIGDSMEITTNGEYKSIEHRAVINKDKERLSIATFHTPSMDTILQPLPELVRGDGELYGAIIFKDFVNEYFSKELNGKRALESMKLKK